MRRIIVVHRNGRNFSKCWHASCCRSHVWDDNPFLGEDLLFTWNAVPLYDDAESISWKGLPRAMAWSHAYSYSWHKIQYSFSWF